MNFYPKIYEFDLVYFEGRIMVLQFFLSEPIHGQLRWELVEFGGHILN